jgi:effector-binding domain-containing protein
MGTHFGAYDKTMYMYTAMDEYIQEFKLEETGGPIEEYITDPMSEPDTSKWQTNIYFPVK